MFDCILEPNFYEFQDDTLRQLDKDIFLLGTFFDGNQDLEDVKVFMKSLLWFTYRKNFEPIGGTGPKTDQGWGCMLRCGQMILAQALINLHLGSSWMWQSDARNGIYMKIIRMFQDKKECNFSVHQIAQMGISEGKNIGEWFGPNTVAQVLKKLVIYDQWSRLAVHIALDNVVIMADIQTIVHTSPPELECPSKSLCSFSSDTRGQCVKVTECTGTSFVATSNCINNTVSESATEASCKSEWRPLLLIIPLRLGLSHTNRCYLTALQAFFKIPQNLGIIGGRPKHALYFVGMAGDRLLYLDPHICQEYVDLDGKDKRSDNHSNSLPVMKTEAFDDSSYHCPFIWSIPYDDIDPSLALAFLCKSEEELHSLWNELNNLITASSPPMFGLLETRPLGFPAFVPYFGERAVIKDYADLGNVYDSYDEFEILDKI